NLSHENWLKLERFFLSRPLLARLYKQMYQDNKHLQSIPHAAVTPAMEHEEIHAANMLFQLIENINSIVVLDPLGWMNPQHDGWLEAFQSWFRSPIMRREWCNSRKFFGQDTNAFIDSLHTSCLLKAPQTAKQEDSHSLRKDQR